MPINPPLTSPHPTLLPKVPVLSSYVSTGSFDDFVETICQSAQAHRSRYVCCANVHMLIEAQQDPAFRQVLTEADLATPDGMPVAKLMGALHRQPQERVAGMDLVPALLRQAARRGLSVFFLGDTLEILGEMERSVRRDFPGIFVAGTFSPPFRDLTPDEEAEMLARIDAANPHLLFVALGCPKQERWMARYRGRIAAVMLGVGNAFRTYLGKEKRAPAWMQRLALEWLYRLLQNPKRLWKRYFVTNTWFIFLALKGVLFRSFRPGS
ncbi:MAG: WecB/TagA/CpsF family glycosyltransferase [Bacteroidia bacterium]